MAPKNSPYRIRLIHWKPSEADQRGNWLKNAGYDVAYEPFNQAVLRALGEDPPDAILIDLSRLPSQGRDIAVGLRTRKTTRHVPLVFVGGQPEKVARVREVLPDAAYMRWDDVNESLPDAIEQATRDPVVPDSVFAGYAGTPLPKKLGIKKDTLVALINAPQEFEQTLGDLPAGVSLDRTPCERPDVALWFVATRAELEREIEKIGPYAECGSLWIIWPKRTSGVESDLTQTVVRKTGLAAGLVDYKIASIDETWSGLRFTIRKG
jgi:CheY-like chemotaxis protein